MIRSFLILLALASALLALPTLAAASGLEVRDGWVREAPPAANAAAYWTLHNTSDAPIRVVGASSDAAARVELHETKIEGDVASMKSVDVVEVPAGESIVFAPGGLHAMLIGPKPLRDGDEITIELEIEGRTDKHAVTLPVKKMGGGGHSGHGTKPSGDEHHH